MSKRIIKLCVFVFVSAMFLAGCSKDKGGDSTVSPSNDPMTQIPDVVKQNEKLGRGINLGNALEAPKEGEWGVTLQEEFFRTIKEKGFNSVRVPIKWSAHASSSAPYTIEPAFFARIDWVVNQALSRGLAVMINIHHYDEMMTDPVNHKARFLSLWSSISDHYKNYNGDLFFEILNEPNNQLTPALWNECLNEAIKVIRQKNPYRTIVVGPAYWNSVDNLFAMTLPADDKNIIATFHYYNPMNFTHQGADWVTGSNAWLGTTWTGTQSQVTALMTDMEKALQWSRVNNRPVNVGEFGAYSKADMVSRAAWTNYVARLAEVRGFSWHYWEFCSGFGAYDASKKAWIDALLNALVPPKV